MWRARPIFVSSTFADMQAERDHLRTHVFPELEERLRQRRHNLEWVDLRLGVATASLGEGEAREMQVLKVCFAEIARCRPFLIVLLGDRYGWVPPAERISAAVVEEGYAGNVVGRSVTEMEIELGVFSRFGQQPRSLFYFRDPLPYAAMPTQLAALYSDAHSSDPQAQQRAEQLASLKQRIASRLPDRSRSYRVGWDGKTQRVTGLDDWGRAVLEDIWRELDAETATAVAKPEPSWQQMERDALEEYIEDRSRKFIGREAVLARLIQHATAPAMDGASWGRCLTGEPGSGKSALFGELVRRLRGCDLFLLAHAAGASPRASSFDDMLRRWIDELATAQGVSTGLTADSSRYALETAFRTLLADMAGGRRVVVAVDALELLGTTAWLPSVLPANVRFISTAVSGEHVEELRGRAGLDFEALPPLDAAEASSIALSICDRYHRALEPEVLGAILAKRGVAGPAWGNPLWIALALEALNLLDADDFARAVRDYSGSVAEKLRSLMLDFVAQLPTDVPGLYRTSFAQAEKIFGAPLSRAFIGLIAISRAGWREVDFRVLLPRVSGEPWDGLRFASLRRFFRGQLLQTGRSAQWNFAHGQMRIAADRYLAEIGMSQPQLHAEASKHLLELSREDPLRQTEVMVHLLRSDAPATAARFYGDSALSDAEELHATYALASEVLSKKGKEDRRGLKKVTDMLTAEVPSDTRSIVASRLVRELNQKVLTLRGELADQLELLTAAKKVFELIAENSPTNTGPLRVPSFATSEEARLQDLLDPLFNLAQVEDAIGDTLQAQGKLQAAADRYAASFKVWERSIDVQNEPAVKWALELFQLRCNRKISRILAMTGQFDKALEAYRSDRAGFERYMPSDFKLPWAAQFYGEYCEVLEGLGNIYKLRNQLAAALEVFRASSRIAEQMHHANPNSLKWFGQFARSRSRVYDVLRAQGDPAATQEADQNIHEMLTYITRVDPTNLSNQAELAKSFLKIGATLVPKSSFEFFQSALAISRRLAEVDPHNTDWQFLLSRSLSSMGDALEVNGQIEAALIDYVGAREIVWRLLGGDSSNSEWRLHMVSLVRKIAGILTSRGDQSGALSMYQVAYDVGRTINKSELDSTTWQVAIAESLIGMGSIHWEKGDQASAFDVFQKATQIYERLIKDDPSNAMHLFSLSHCHERLGDVFLASGRLEEALGHFQAAREKLLPVATASPEIQAWQTNLSIANERIGTVLRKQGNFSAALEAFRASHAIILRLVDAYPGQLQFLIFLSISHHRFAELYVDLGDLDAARSAYEACVMVRKHAAEVSPDNPQSTAALAAAYGNLGTFLTKLGKRQEAAKLIETGRLMLKSLLEKQPDNRTWQVWLKALDDGLQDALNPASARPNQSQPAVIAVAPASRPHLEQIVDTETFPPASAPQPFPPQGTSQPEQQAVRGSQSAPTSPAPRRRGSLRAIASGLRHAFKFKGRSTRAELWLFLLFSVIALFAAAVVDVSIFKGQKILPIVGSTLLLLVIPILSLLVRRLHDFGRTGWWLLIVLVPYVGPLFLLVLLLWRSDPSPNKYGPR